MSGSNRDLDLPVEHFCPLCRQSWRCFLHCNCGESDICPDCSAPIRAANRERIISEMFPLDASTRPR